MTDSDTLLLQRFCQTRDPEAFSEIVRLYASVVYGTCKRIVNDSDLAADISQETFFQLLRSAADVSGSLAGWLHTVATRKAIDRVRKDSARKARELEYSGTRLHEAQTWHEVSPYVDEALGQIDDQLRQVLVKHFLEGQTTRQVAESLGCSQATVSRKVSAGLGSLRAVLKKRGIIVAAISLSGLMAQNAAQAAPAVLVAELGKMSLAAGGTVAASAAATAITAIKVKIVTAVAVAAIGTGAVVTYNIVTKPSQPEAPQTVTAVDRTPTESKVQPADQVDNISDQEWIAFWEDVAAEEKAAKPAPAPIIAEYEEPEPEPESKLQAQEPQDTATPPVAVPREAMGGRVSRWRGEDSNEHEQPPRYGAGGYGGTRSSSKTAPSNRKTPLRFSITKGSKDEQDQDTQRQKN